MGCHNGNDIPPISDNILISYSAFETHATYVQRSRHQRPGILESEALAGCFQLSSSGPGAVLYVLEREDVPDRATISRETESDSNSTCQAAAVPREHYHVCSRMCAFVPQQVASSGRWLHDRSREPISSPPKAYVA